MSYMRLYLVSLLAPFVFLAFITNRSMQSSQSSGGSFVITSWKKGDRQINPLEFEITLDRESNQYQRSFMTSDKDVNYDLLIKHSPASEKGPYYEYWTVMLFEDSPQYPKSKRKSSNNLLKISEGPLGGDFFPKEDSIGLLYPVEDPSLRKHGVLAYPFLAKRVIKIENFYVIVQVSNYKRSSDNPRLLDNLTIKIKLSNSME